MDLDVPYMLSAKNLTKILDAIQHAGVPDSFNQDFLRDLGFTSSNDRGAIKVLRYLGMLDASNRPQSVYRDFMDHTRARGVLATAIMKAYDDLYTSDRTAHARTSTVLKGWFKSKTGVSEPVAEKMATTFSTLAKYADFSAARPQAPAVLTVVPEARADAGAAPTPPPSASPGPPGLSPALPAAVGLVYRIEIHLPDTQNVDTFRAIFKALREELVS